MLPSSPCIRLMFFGLKQPFETGKVFVVDLQFKSGSQQRIPVIVGAPAGKNYSEALTAIAELGNSAEEPANTSDDKDHGAKHDHSHHHH